jgi:hypothetical protein
LAGPAAASTRVMSALNVARAAWSWLHDVVGTAVVVVLDGTLVLVELEVDVLVLVDVDDDVLVLVDAGVEVDVLVEVDVDVDTAPPAKLMWWAAERLSNWSVRRARITHWVT